MNYKTKKKNTYSFDDAYIIFLCQKIKFYQKELDYLNHQKPLWFQKNKIKRHQNKIKEYEEKIIEAYTKIGDLL